MLTKQEAAARLDIHEHTVASWAKHGLIASHAYIGHYYLYKIPDSDLPQKQRHVLYPSVLPNFRRAAHDR